MSKLKPCPFCGNKAEVYEECELIKIRCSNYMCQASVNSWHDEVEDAIDAWNKRSADRPQGEWIYCEDYVGHDGYECSNCGFFIPWVYDYYADSNFILNYHTCPHCDARMKEQKITE